MNMDNILHTYLTKLSIISKIPSNGKINITNNDLNIYYDSVVNWMLRKFHGDNKYNATKYLTELYREINLFSDQLMYSIESEINNTTKIKKINMLVSLAEKIKESMIGVKNLIGTYKEYLKVISLLECLEHDIIIPQYRCIKEFIPEDYHTIILKTPLLYSPEFPTINTVKIHKNTRSYSENHKDNIRIDSPIIHSLSEYSKSPTDLKLMSSSVNNSNEDILFRDKKLRPINIKSD
jgi:hypothetical protein